MWRIKVVIIISILISLSLLSFLFWTLLSPLIIFGKWLFSEESYWQVAKMYFREMFGRR